MATTIKSKWQVRKWKNFDGANKWYILESPPILKRLSEDTWELSFETHTSHDQVSVLDSVHDYKEDAEAKLANLTKQEG